MEYRGSLLFLVLIHGLSGSLISEHRCTVDLERAAPLTVINTYSLPLLEGSGLGVFGQNLVAVSDREVDLVTFHPETPKATNSIELSTAFQPILVDGSQFEAVATDGAGRVFILAELSGAIYVVDPVERNILHTIHLSIPHGHPLHAPWRLDPNSRGEGLVLLKNGHVLVLKEKKPRALVEFGPAGDGAVATEENAPIIGRQRFRIPRGTESRYVPLRTWKFKRATRAFASDLSDMMVGPGGELFLISDKSKTLLRVSLPLPARSRIFFDGIWNLPGEVEKPEGVAVIESGVWVLSDRKKPRNNLFHLQFPDKN